MTYCAPDLSPDAAWKRRFRAARLLSASISANAPERGLAVANLGNLTQLYAWNIPTGDLRAITDEPTGKRAGLLSPDGCWVYYHQDDTGNEIGHLVRIPYDGGEALDVTPDLPPYALCGVAISRDGSTFGLTAATREGIKLYVTEICDNGMLGRLCPIYNAMRHTSGPALSFGGELAIMSTTERTGTIETSLIAINTHTREILGELIDEAASVEIGLFSSVPGDMRHLGSTSCTGIRRPVLWNPIEGERRDYLIPLLNGDLIPVAWSEDGNSILLQQIFQAKHSLHWLDLDSEKITPFIHPEGTISSVCNAPHGDIVVALQSSAHPLCIYRMPQHGDKNPSVLLKGDDVPASRRWRSINFYSNDQQKIQGWIATPHENGPFPTIIELHGGPCDIVTDTYSPRAQSWIDNGYAFLTINYRGSISFGREFQQSIQGRLGNLELDDMVAARNWLIEQDIAIPEAIFLTGQSYGGYLTLMGMGVHPELWAGGIAQVAIADWRLMYEDEAEPLRRYQVNIFGGTPNEKPEAHARSSPITYAEHMRAPILIIQSSNDSRCPARQMKVFEQRMMELGKKIEVVWFEAGHSSCAVEQNIEHIERMLRFAHEVLTRRLPENND